MRTLRRDRVRFRQGLDGDWSDPVSASVSPVSTIEGIAGADLVPMETRFRVIVGPEVVWGAVATTYAKWDNVPGDDLFLIEGSTMPVTRNGVCVAVEFVMKKYT